MTAAEKSEATTAKRESDKTRRAGEAEQRKDAQERKAEERRRQRERLEDERRRETDRLSTAAQIADTERRLAGERVCKSAAQLDLLLGKVTMAVGIDDTIADIDAIVFATRFYSTLAEGQSVEAALTTARVEMKLNGLPDHDLPTMRSVDGVDPADI